MSEVAAVISFINPANLRLDHVIRRLPQDEYHLVAQGIVSRAGISPEELEQWLFVEFSEHWGLSFTRADAAAMREAVEPALERYRSTPDAGGTILRGSDDTTDDSREPT